MAKSPSFNAQLITDVITPGPLSANTEFAVSHALGRVPVEAFVWKSTKPPEVYRSTTAWTNTTIYLKANATSAQFNLLLV